MPTKSFQDIGTRYGSDYVIAIGDVSPAFKTNGMATVLDVVNRRQVCEFPVRYECGGGPRLTLSTDKNICLAGCYDAYAIAGYSIPEGREIWRRKELKSVQVVEPLYDNDLVFCGRENGAAHLLGSTTGKTVEKFSGVKKLFSSPFDGSVIVSGRSVALQRPLGRKIAAHIRISDLKTCVFSPVIGLLLDYGGGIHCIDLESGASAWSLKPDDKVKYGGFLWFDPQNCFIGVKSVGDESNSFVKLDPSSGAIMSEIPFVGRGNGAFCSSGDLWLEGDLRLLSTSTGSEIHDFATAAMLRRDPRYKHELLLSLARDASSLEDLERYMVEEGFSAVDIKKALFLRVAGDLRNGRSE